MQPAKVFGRLVIERVCVYLLLMAIMFKINLDNTNVSYTIYMCTQFICVADVGVVRMKVTKFIYQTKLNIYVCFSSLYANFIVSAIISFAG